MRTNLNDDVVEPRKILRSVLLAILLLPGGPELLNHQQVALHCHHLTHVCQVSVQVHRVSNLAIW